MQPRVRLTRTDAAVLLGVPVDAPPATVRHAWRMWARIAHPDVGGDPDHFARLEQARRVMMIPDPRAIPTVPRARLREVLRRPAHALRLAGGALVAVALVALPVLLDAGARRGDLHGGDASLVWLALACAPGALAAAGVAVMATRECLQASADRGHRIAVVCFAWLAVAVPQMLVATAVGVDLLPVLPVMALPLVAVVGSLDPAIGLWRPGSSSQG